MTKTFGWLDRKMQLVPILLLFWALFWVLSAGDRVFETKTGVGTATWSKTGIIVNSRGKRVFQQYSALPYGFYGTNQSAKAKTQYARLGVPKAIGTTIFTVITVAELMVGLLFMVLLFRKRLGRLTNGRPAGLWGLFNDHTLYRLALKSSAGLLILFALGDILFGDKAALWEHGVFLMIALVTYDLWLRSGQKAGGAG